jgi:hypothetical protein
MRIGNAAIPAARDLIRRWRRYVYSKKRARIVGHY